MELNFSKDQYGNVYNIEMSEEFMEAYESYEREEQENEQEFLRFLEENNIKI